MKTLAFKILVIFFSAGFNHVFSSPIPETKRTIPQQDLKINRVEDPQAYYEKGMSYYKMGEYLSAEEAFLKATELAEKSQEKEILSYSFHFLGNPIFHNQFIIIKKQVTYFSN